MPHGLSCSILLTEPRHALGASFFAAMLMPQATSASDEASLAMLSAAPVSICSELYAARYYDPRGDTNSDVSAITPTR